MNKCKICGNLTNRPKFCSEKCQKKSWKLYNREKYLAGKRAYRKKHRKQIREYNRLWKAANSEKVKQYQKNYASKKRSN